jgi:hypothetical protein
VTDGQTIVAGDTKNKQFLAEKCSKKFNYKNCFNKMFRSQEGHSH